MTINWVLVLGSSLIGLLVGLTGMGGGALMTPMLVLLFGVSPSSAITSDLVAALFMKPIGVAVHWRRETLNLALVKYLCYGSMPAAFLGTYVMHLMGNSSAAEKRLELLLGAALLLGGLSMYLRAFRRQAHRAAPIAVRPLATVAVGAVGGFMVGLTSVGAGSLILILLLVLYPNFQSDQLVGTDLAQSLPLTLGATVGSLVFGHVSLGITTSIIIGSVPTVFLGSLISSRTNSPLLRRIIMAVVFLTGLKYVGVPTAWLGYCAVLLSGVVVTQSVVLRRRAHATALS